ncbi:MAG: BatD family protein [Cyclobacteriaceae bacterium]|nr:BatD family protein [Cyclobacteriaceae bacterium]
MPKQVAFAAIFSCFLVLTLIQAQAQSIRIDLGPDEIGENQAWTITVTVANQQLRSYDNFPEIEGFRKRGTSTNSQTSIINGQVSSSQGVIMTYTPTKQGIFTVPPFKMKINDQVVSSSGKKIKVTAPVQAQGRDPFRSLFDRDPFEDFFGGRRETEFVDVKEDALLSLSTSKDEVYVGEGFTTTLSFLIAENNQAPMQFHDLSRQLSEVVKQLSPDNCWVENFNIENIEPERVVIGGKGYTQYKLFQATMYPLNNKPIAFPSVPLEMIKYKMARNPSFFGQNRQEDFKTFRSKEKTVKVKELPPHPMRDAVPVGDYHLQEKLTPNSLATGQSATYEFAIAGEGNISGVEKPALGSHDAFEVYEPNIRQDINRENGRVAGTKTFTYFLIPREPGDYALKEIFQMVFFNPRKKAYDTLRSAQVLNVTGESQKNLSISSNDGGSFYDRLNTAGNTLQSSAGDRWFRMSFNILILIVLGLSVWLVFRKRA